MTSPEFSILQALNEGETCDNPWHLALNLLYTTEHGDHVVLCFEHLFDCDDPPLQTVLNVIDYIRQALKVGKLLVQGHEGVVVHWQCVSSSSCPHPGDTLPLVTAQDHT